MAFFDFLKPAQKVAKKVVKGAAEAAGAAERQFNFLDDNKTAQDKIGTPTGRSTIQQATDAGVGLAKATVAPFAYLAKVDLVNPTRELAADITGNKEAKANAVRQSNIDLGLGPEGNNLKGGLRTFAGNAGQVALSFLGPEASALAKGAVAKVGLEGVGARVAEAGATGATLGAPFGATSVVADPNQPLTVENLLKGAGYGAAGGVFLGATGEGLHQAIKARRPLHPNEVGGGQFGRNVSDEEVNKLQKATNVDEIKNDLTDIVPPEKAETVAHAVSVATDPHAIRSIIRDAKLDEPPHVTTFVKDYADALQQMESGMRGGILAPDGQGGQIRSSEHTPFYRKTYETKGRAPNKTDYIEEAHKQLRTGTADEFAQREYDALKNPETASLLQQDQSYFAPDTTVGNVSQVSTSPPLKETTTYRGGSKEEWQSVQKTGKFGKNQKEIGDPQGKFNDDVHTVSNKKYAENYAHTGNNNGVVFEFKPKATKKMRNSATTETTDMGTVQEHLGKGLGIDDVQRVTDKDGNILYEAPSTKNRTREASNTRGLVTYETASKELKSAGFTDQEVSELLIDTPEISVVGKRGVDSKKLWHNANLYETRRLSPQRGYLTKAQTKENITPDVKQALSEVKPQTYERKPNQELVSKTKQLVDDSPAEALQRVFEGADTPAKYDENVALGGHLIQKAQKEGRIEDAVRIAERLDNNGRELGRGVQAYAAIHRLSPEGILLYAQRQVRKSREGNKKFANEVPEASDIKRQIEGFNPEDKSTVQGAIKQTVRELSGTTGEKLAKRVEGAAKPAVAKKTDVLVQELTKKVKQEFLEPKTKAAKPPLQILQETFGRADEAAKAYPEAQALLREKYANNPQMSEALDKFFGSNLGPIPAASTTVDKAIQAQLKGKEVQVMKAIYKSWAEQKQTIGDIAKTLTKEGFDAKSAQILAKEVTDRLNKQFGEAKARTLERLSAEAPEKAKQTYIDKLNKLSNIGALDKSDYIDLARAKLNLPNLKPETAKELSELAQHIQTLPEGAEKYAATRKMKQLIEENTPATGKQKLAQGFGTPRALLASGDISFGGRQALAYATSHPVKFVKQWGKQFKFFKEGFQGDDSRAFDELMGEIQSHPDYKLLQKTDLALTDPFGISPNAREEQFIGSHYAEKVPAIGRLVRGSNYAFTGLANSIRANEFYAQLEHARGAGLDLKPKLLDDLAEVINTSTGRGNAKFLETHMKSLSTALFAPRLILSRLQTFNPHYYMKLEPLARKEALRNLMSLSAFATGILTAASQVPGAQVGTNPKSSDFGKVKIGDTHLDFLGGFTQYIRLGAQLATGETVSSLSGRTSQLGTGYGKKSRKDILAKFLENKENPVVSFATTLLSGQDAVGNPVKSPKDISEQVVSRFIPLVAQDVNDMRTHDKGINPLIGAPLAAVGIGTQTYGKGDIKLSDKQQKIYDALAKSGAPKAKLASYKDFYQTLKTTPDRNAVSDAINKALQDEDFEKARTLATKYNKDYATTFKPWAEQYGEYEDPTLRKEYNSKKILLTGEDIRTRLKNIRKNQLTSAVLGG